MVVGPTVALWYHWQCWGWYTLPCGLPYRSIHCHSYWYSLRFDCCDVDVNKTRWVYHATFLYSYIVTYWLLSAHGEHDWMCIHDRHVIFFEKWCFLFHCGPATNRYCCIHLMYVLNVHAVKLWECHVAALNYLKACCFVCAAAVVMELFLLPSL